MTTPALQGLADLARDVHLREGLVVQRQAAQAQVKESRARYDDAVAALAGELEDVDRLESMSLTRIIAGLRGSRDTDLDRERAEAEAARYTANSEDARLQAAQRDVTAVQERIDEVGDVSARREQLLARREQEIATDPASAATAARLTELVTQCGTHEGELAEIEEAVTAAGTALGALQAAGEYLGKAHDWSTYDTFFGGGLVGDMMKYDRLDQAGKLMERADVAMRRLAVELADVDMSGVGGLEVTELTQFFDVWFDNIFSDWAVRDRIRKSLDRVTLAATQVSLVREDLNARRRRTIELRAGLVRQREGLLGA